MEESRTPGSCDIDYSREGFQKLGSIPCSAAGYEVADRYGNPSHDFPVTASRYYSRGMGIPLW